MSEKLAPCPYCGSSGAPAFLGENYVWIECRTCWSGGPLATNEADARAYWSRRAEPRLAVIVEALAAKHGGVDEIPGALWPTR